MAEGRPAIPRELKRAVLVEAGHRCAIPTCRAYPVEIEHIDDWAQVREHSFENLIALCPTCHRRKGDGPDQIDRKSLRQYKTNLALLNQRYGDFERRVLEHFARLPNNDIVSLPGALDLMLSYLIKDGILIKLTGGSEMSFTTVLATGHRLNVPATEHYLLTPAGRDLVNRWSEAQPFAN
ncbi:HNH endonuclease signature motif containing protein [Nocardiopsis sp. NPDC060348]|uniref:HNH endonuclease n=1 Tax=unclassified Nocardiopsis TaxID=2649073 RepID=UPI00093D4F92